MNIWMDLCHCVLFLLLTISLDGGMASVFVRKEVWSVDLSVPVKDYAYFHTISMHKAEGRVSEYSVSS